MSYIGDFPPWATIDHKFTTVISTGAPTTLVGSPSILMYEGNNTVETSAGLTLTTDFDSKPGYHNVRVVGTTAGLAHGKDYTLVLVAGTVGGVSVAGYRVCSFSVHNRSAHEAIYYGTVTGTSTTTNIVDSGLTPSAAGYWAGRIAVFLSAGNLLKQIGIITNSAAGSLTVSPALTTAPIVGDPYAIY